MRRVITKVKGVSPCIGEVIGRVEKTPLLKVRVYAEFSNRSRWRKPDADYVYFVNRKDLEDFHCPFCK